MTKFQQSLVLILLTFSLVIAGYFIMSPYQKCMSNASKEYPREPVTNNDVCQKNTSWQQYKQKDVYCGFTHLLVTVERTYMFFCTTGDDDCYQFRGFLNGKFKHHSISQNDLKDF